TFGNAWTIGVQCYPATQPGSGSPCWGDLRVATTQFTDPHVKCITDIQGLRNLDLIRTSNASGVPDSIRIFLGKQQQCFRFGITSNCSSSNGAYFDNVSVGFRVPTSIHQCSLTNAWHPGPSIKIVRPLANWPNGADLSGMRPGDVIAFSLLAKD